MRSAKESCSKKGQEVWCASSLIQNTEPVPFSLANFESSLKTYNTDVRQFGEDRAFGKDRRLLQPLTGKIGFMKVSGKVVTTLGGLLIDEKARVINRQGQPIHGLTAAGDAVGGLFGCWSATGDNLAAAAVFGRIAGRTLSITG